MEANILKSVQNELNKMQNLPSMTLRPPLTPHGRQNNNVSGISVLQRDVNGSMSPSVSRTFSEAFGQNSPRNVASRTTSRVDEDGFQKVSYRNATSRGVSQGQNVKAPQDNKGNFGNKLKSLSVITGKKVINTDTDRKFAAAPRDIFVYNTHPETTADDVKIVLEEAEIKLFGSSLKKSHEESWMASFHVRVCHDDYDKLQSPDIWPMGWKCRDFIRRRPKSDGDKQQCSVAGQQVQQTNNDGQ